jgi:hypothetical protein
MKNSNEHRKYCNKCNTELNRHAKFCPHCGISLEDNNMDKKNNIKFKPNLFNVGCGLFIILFVFLFLLTANENKNAVISTKQESAVITKEKVQQAVKAKEKTKASESKLNNMDIPTLAVQRKLTSDGLTKADIAYWALNSYGYDCEEVKSVKNVNYEIDRMLQYLTDSDIDANGIINGLKSPVYKDVTCTSGVKLRLYKRIGNYPYIIEQ